ncbi:iron-containing alcohol dehydrogenase [Amycolatopsis sp. NPDC051903]|uniref:iron-containing alcohol dehydrogenase n=1 Tax=Amycolatopsis sp. NPDC051903 TaxID=3363936 RepID=UPI0037B521FF
MAVHLHGVARGRPRRRGFLRDGRQRLHRHPGRARGFALLTRGLRAVARDPADLGARLDCRLGAWLAMAPLASGVPMGASHGIGYVLGAAFDVPHGHTSCVLLPAVLAWNAEVNGARQRELLAQSGIGGEQAADVVRNLVRDLDLPATLGAVGVGPANEDEVAERAMGTPWVPRNPRPIDGPHHVKEILALAR